MGLKKDRPKITRSNFVCAEPMPGEEQMLKEFVGQLEPKFLGQLVEVVFEKMKLAGEAGSLSRSRKRFGMPWSRRRSNGFEKQLEPQIAKASRSSLHKRQWTDSRANRNSLQCSIFRTSPMTSSSNRPKAKVIEALRQYAEKSSEWATAATTAICTDDAVQGFAFVDLCQKAI